jgi:hypothetical protein
MTEQAPEEFHPSVDDDEAVEASEVSEGFEPGSPVATGVASVDRVLSELDGLDELPLDDHIGAFERAHESLRSALDAPPDPAPDDLA